MLIRSSLSATVAVLLTFTSLFGETQVSGNVEGRWSPQGNPFIATSNLTIQRGRVLQIDPGVVVEFRNGFTFFVYGRLNASGTENDSIRLYAVEGAEGWGGIRFLSAEANTLMDYCVVTGGRAFGGQHDIDSLGSGGNIFISAGDVTINHSRISGGNARSTGGGIAIWRAQSSIQNTTVSVNVAAHHGGGISICFGSNPTITNCTISENSCVINGGGIFVFAEANPAITGCTIFRNQTTNGEGGSGGGLFAAEAASPVIRKCDFIENLSAAGGGMFTRGMNTNPEVTWCYFFANAASMGARVGGAMYIRGGSGVRAKYNRFVGNNAHQGGAIYIKEPPRTNIDHCLFLRNSANRFGGAVAASSDLGEVPFRLDNCTFINNETIAGEFVAHTAFARRPAEGQPGSYIRINSSIVFGPTPLFAEEGRVAVNYSNIVGGFPGMGNTPDDPEFFPPDSIWFVLTGESNCVDNGDSTLVRDPDGTINDRGWLHFPQNAWANFENDPLTAELTVGERRTVEVSFRNETPVPIFASAMDRWKEKPRDLFMNISAITEDSEIMAVTPLGEDYFIAGSNNGETPRYIYRLNHNFDLVDQYEQPGEIEGYGFSDLATDGSEMLFGSIDDFVVEFTASGEFGQDYHVPDGMRDCDGIACDTKFTEGTIEFYLGGDEGRVILADDGMFRRAEFSVRDSIYGLGSRQNAPGLYALSRFGRSKTMLWHIDPTRALVTPLYLMNVPGGFTPGGFEVTQGFRDGKAHLFGVYKGAADDPDRIYATELYSSWIAAKPQLMLLMPGEEASWEIEFTSDQMPAGNYSDSLYLAVNGYGVGGEIPVALRSNPDAVTGSNLAPLDFALGTPFPNPFNSSTRISFSLSRVSHAAITLTDQAGRLIRKLAAGEFDAGTHQLTVDASALPAGSYFVRMETPSGILVESITVVK
jgi:parallel beta-helix repeat protein/predicted outer membrane repeat protein